MNTSTHRSIRAIGRFIHELYSQPFSAIGTTIVLFFLVMAVFGPWMAPYSANDQGNPPRTSPTASVTGFTFGEYPFGTDRFGQDVFSRIILGTQSIFRIAGLGTLTAVIAGTIIGLFMGYQGGWVDEILGRIIDALLAIPPLLLALVMAGAIRSLELTPNSWQAQIADNSVLVVIALLYVPIVARVVRSSTLELKTRQFVEAAQIRGESRLYIIFREIFPSVIPSLVVEASLRFSYAIFLVASLSFLGFGAPPGSPDWGLMVSENRSLYHLTPWALEYPAIAIALLVVSVNLMSDGIKRVVQKSG